ncbi:MAG: tetratricopeptide repeat protein [Gammaproteobacteria bacterium]|jgi:tetratricopeptide (TPR) repeat protein|nr:tetratricopeptide repeat protein [Gammaproteobacteria bacterium]
MNKLIGTVFLLWALVFSQSGHAASELERANQLIGEGKYIEAFELLEPLEFDMSGDENFDLLFGFTALEAGHISLATLALERVLAVNPNNNTARFHLARAYYVLNDFDGARREFEMLLSMNPTAGIRETVGQYLDAISARKPTSATVITGFISAGIGSDSNVTGATSTNPIFLPVLGDLYEIPESDLEQRDDYSDLAGGIDLVHRFDENSSVYLGGNVNSRGFSNRDDLNYLFVGLRTGYQRNFGNQVVRAGLNVSNLELDQDDYQDSGTLELEWRNTLAQRAQLGVVLSQNSNRFQQQEDEESDYDDRNVSISYLRVLGEKGDKLASAEIGFGQEVAKNDRDDGDMDYVEFSLTGQIQFTDLHSAFLLVSYRDMEYDSENSLYLKKRSESQTAVVGGLVFGINTTVSVRLTAIISQTSSNLSLYDVEREDITISLRKDFL